MDALEALKTRRSVRSYQKKPVDRAVLEEILDCARLAPTAMNQQPWDFVVVASQETREQIAGLTGHAAYIKEAPVCIAVFCREMPFWLEDGCAATENILIAAQALGLGTCWVVGDKMAYAEGIRDLLGGQAAQKLVSLVSLGYPAENPSKPKRALAEVVHWERM